MLGGLLLGGAALFASSSQAAICSYTVANEWNTGFQGNITVTNNGTTAINGWNVGWQYTNNKITSSWNATLSGSNPYTATNLDWNKTIQPGQSVSFGVQGDKNGSTAEKPVITGAVCGGASSSSSSSSVSTNHAPVAVISSPTGGTILGSRYVNLSAAGSSDSDGDALTYEWNVNNGTILTGINATYDASIAGGLSTTVIYTLTVRDGRGGIGTKNGQVWITWETQSSSSARTSSTGTTSSSRPSSSSVASSASCASMCNWYGTLYPVCVTTTSGWGYENGKSCIATSTCAAQPSPYGVVSYCTNSSSVSSVSSSKTSVSSSSVVVSSSSKSSLSSSSVVSSSSKSSSSSVASSAGVASLKALADFPIGMAVGAGNESDSIISSATAAQQQAVVFQHFNQLTAGNIMKMSYLHPSENTYTFTQADELVAFAAAHDLKMHAHTLIWHSDYQVPNFMKNYTGDFATMLKAHVQTIVTHFAGKVVSWDVVNEALAEDGDSSAVNGYRNSVFYQKMGADFIDQAFINARAADPTVDLFYNDFNIENGGTKTTNLLAMLDGMKARAIPITGVGFQMHVLLDWPSTSTIEAAMKAVADRGLKVKISEFDVRVNNPYNSSATVYTSLTADAAAKQKERYRQIVASYMKVVPPAQRAGITTWGVWDTDSWLNTSSNPDWPLLFDANFLPKPALQGFANGLTGRND